MSGLLPQITSLTEDMKGWRRHLHAHPETAFEEHNTADFVADLLTGFGVEIHRGLAGTGIVGVIPGKRPGTRSIGLRADMDALHIHEETNLPHASTEPGKMHACGHDGHMAMLLGATKHLAANRDFAGTLHVIFQPAEENEGGGRVMVEQGLFDQFPMETVYGMHNWPGLEVGHIASRVGPVMAGYDIFEITLRGRGGHAAMPHLGTDQILASAHLVTALQSIPSRSMNPLESAVVSVTQIHGGDTWNVIPSEVVLRGTVRTFETHVQDMVEARMAELTETVAKAFGAEGSLRYERRYPATVNSAEETAIAMRVAASVVGEQKVDADCQPTMGAEDFAYMLQARPGCYVRLGAGPGLGGCMLHNPGFDFNDEILAVGASYWVRLVEDQLV
jgi:hippurate hydrolase